MDDLQAPRQRPDFSQAHAYLAAKQPQSAPYRAGPHEDIAEQPELQVAG